MLTFNPAGVEEMMKCSFCKQRFINLIKQVPECAESICGECYEEVKNMASDSGEYKCKVCQEVHLMPERILRNEN